MFFGGVISYGGASIIAEQLGQLEKIDPNLIVALFLTFIKNQLQAKMQMAVFDPVDIFFGAIAGPPHVADNIPGHNNLTFLKTGSKRPVFAQVGIIIVTAAIKM